MKKLLAVIAIAVCSLGGIALAQYGGPQGGAQQMPVPKCPTGYNIQCMKIFGGTDTACRCVNPTTNAALGVISYTPVQVNELVNSASIDDSTVATIVNAT